MYTFIKYYLGISILLSLSTTYSNAQNVQSTFDSAKHLQEVVITGQYQAQSLRQSVYQVKIINSERIRLSGGTNVQQVLNNQLGFRFSNDNTLGTTDISLMGMSGRNVKILLDGVPMIDRGDTRESLNQIDINIIERIEIVEGPMSVSYGSDALAGVINIITKKFTKDKLSVIAKVQEETAGSEYSPFGYLGVHAQSINVSGTKNKWNFTVGGTHNNLKGFGGDSYERGKIWKPKEQWIGNAKLGYSNNAFNIYYRINGLNENIVSKNTINPLTFKAIDQEYITNRFIHEIQSEYKFKNNLQLSGITAYTDYSRKTQTTRRNFSNNTIEPNQAGEDDIAKFNSVVFRPTLYYKASDKISIQSGIDINREEASGQRIAGNPVITDYALFISSEIKATKKINIRPGLRFIKNSLYDAPPVIPSINTKLTLTPKLDLRVAYAYGFRSPALRELYFNFVDANHTILGNPNLKAEYSNSFNGSLSYNPLHEATLYFSSTINGFYNEFNNLISYATNPDNSSETITVNIDKFKTTGATWENKLTWKDLSVTIGLSYIGRYNRLSEDSAFKSENLPQFVWTPEINSNITYTVKKINTTIALFYKYTGERPGYQTAYNDLLGKDEVKLTKIEGFHWADLTITKPFYKNFTINAGIKNLFDVTSLTNTSSGEGAHSTGGPVPMSYGKSYFIGVGFQWNKK